MGAIAEGIETATAGATEVLRYRVPGAERVVYAGDVPGGQSLVDVPADGDGQLFTVDSCWRNDGTLRSFLEDYREVGERLGVPPASPAACAEARRAGECEEDALHGLYARIGGS